MSEAPALEATGLGKRYRRKWALRDCSLAVPKGRVAALVGPNGAGKTTLLHLAVGLLPPSRGSVRTTGDTAFLAQDKPLYAGLSVAETLKFGRLLNPRWDDGFARARVEALGLSLEARAGGLSGGQQAQVALTLALAKRPDLLVLDEPLANLDPLARHDVMRGLMEVVAETGLTVLLSSHVMSDLRDTCDWLIVLNGGRVQVSGDIDELLTAHSVLTGPTEELDALARRVDVVEMSRSPRQATLLARTGPAPLGPQWTQRRATLEELVLAYLRRPDAASLPRPTLATA